MRPEEMVFRRGEVNVTILLFEIRDAAEAAGKEGK